MDWLMNPLSKCLKGFFIYKNEAKIGSKEVEIPFVEKFMQLNENMYFKCCKKLKIVTN